MMAPTCRRSMWTRSTNCVHKPTQRCTTIATPTTICASMRCDSRLRTRRRARFETDRQIERNASLQRELAVSKELSGRQLRQLRWNAVVAATGICIIALLIYFLITNVRYRQRLVTLASQDGLTGLPNRRRIAEFAATALETARTTGRGLT